MEPRNPPGWLCEIRDYWSRLTVKLAEETGGPGEAEVDDSLAKRLGASTPLPEDQPPDQEALCALQEEAE